MIDTFGTGTVDDEKLVEAVEKVFSLTPAGIIEMLDLRRPIYKQTAAYGHFGRDDLDLPWEKTDKVDELKSALAQQTLEKYFKSGIQNFEYRLFFN